MNVDKELQSALQETTSDEVLKKEIVKEVVYREATNLANALDLIPQKNFVNLDFKMAFPTEDLTGEYPVAEGAVAELGQVDWVRFANSLEKAEVRFALTDEARLRQLDNSTVNFSRRRASESLAKLKDTEIIDALEAGAGTSGVGGTTDPANDIISGMTTIFENSNIPALANFRILVPTDAFGKLLKITEVGNIHRSVREHLKEAYDIEFFPTRSDALAVDRALMVAYSDQTAFHGVLDTNEIPLVEERRESGMQLYVVRQYFKTQVVPSTADAETSNRIVTIDTSSW